MSGKKKQAKHTGSPAARASKAVPVQPGAAVFLPKAPAAVFSGPVIVAFTFMAVMGYWKLTPEVSETTRRFVNVQQGVPGQPLPPPALPSKVPLHIKGFVDQAVRSAKIAWLKECNRADVTGHDISDERLNHLYKEGRRWYSRHASNPEVRATDGTSGPDPQSVHMLPCSHASPRHADEAVRQCEPEAQPCGSARPRSACHETRFWSMPAHFPLISHSSVLQASSNQSWKA